MDTIAVIDFGGQYAHLIANRVRRLQVYSEIFPPSVTAEELKGYKGIILSGGPQSVYAEDSLQCDLKILNLPVPILGICYGHQLLTHLLGGKVTSGTVKEYGKANLSLEDAQHPLFQGLSPQEQVWMSHFDEVVQLPKDAKIIGSSEDCHYAAVDFGQNRFGIQFHCEVTHTPHGMTILDNFLTICDVRREWNLDNFIEEELERIRKQAEGKNVFLLISGGVDSTVAFLLLEKALGPERVYGLFVNHGLMRKNEVQEVQVALAQVGVKNLHVVDASEQFLKALHDVYDPEEKRHIIGDQFLVVQKKVAEALELNPDEWLLGQGTIYPDTIESGGTKHADRIKTHHNRVPQIEELIAQGKIIEPIKELYKDEVRLVGEKLGLDAELVERHPFPGPGLGVRCLCAKGPSPIENTPALESEINAFLAAEGLALTGKILPLKSVGVQGDVRSYRHPVALSGQATWAQLEAISPKLTNRFLMLNRVLYHVHAEAIQGVNVKPGFIRPERLDLLREADDIVQSEMKKAHLQKVIWQFPVVLLPVYINQKVGESIVLRPVSSQEAMTANFTPIGWSIVHTMAEKIVAIPGISTVFYDVTNKPPGTIEWE